MDFPRSSFSKLRNRNFSKSFCFFQYFSVGSFNVIVAFLILGIWGKSLSDPWFNGGDGELNFILVRNVQRSGWIFENSQLGTPSEFSIHDLPQGGENFQFLVMKIISYFASAVGAVNIFFLLTFPIIALAAFGAARWWGSKPITAFLISSLYAFLPYHFFRGQGHLLLSLYAFMPFVVVYCFKSVNQKVELSRFQWVVFVICAGSINSYYTVFGLVLLVFALLYNLIKKVKINIRQQFILIGSIISVFIFNQLPSIIFMLQNGKNTALADRGYDGAEVYGLQITNMFLPRIGHRIGLFSSAGTAVSNAGLRSESGQALGLMASIGIVTLILYGTFKLIRQEPLSEKLQFPFLMTMGLILLTVSSSVTLILGMARFTEIRSWNRVVIIIGFIGLLVFGHLLESIAKRINLSRTSIGLVFFIVLIIGIFDQTSAADRIGFSAAGKRQKSECNLIESLEKRTIKENGVFQIPFVQFPEAGTVGKLGPYEQGLATLCNTNLQFSFGAMRGRDDNFQRRLGSYFRCATKESCSSKSVNIERSLQEMRSRKFGFLLLYRAGYDDNGKSIEEVLTKKLGESISSHDGTRLVFPL